MINKTPSPSIYESWNDVYLNNNVWELPWVSKEIHPELKKVIDSLPIKKGNALDVGCGLGQVSRYLAQVGFDVTAIDISEEAIRLNRELNDTGKRIDYCVANSIHFQCDKKFDLIVDFLHLHDLYRCHLRSYLQNIDNNLQNKGIFIVSYLTEATKRNRSSFYSILLVNFYTLNEIVCNLPDYIVSYSKLIKVGKEEESYQGCLHVLIKS